MGKAESRAGTAAAHAGCKNGNIATAYKNRFKMQAKAHTKTKLIKINLSKGKDRLQAGTKRKEAIGRRAEFGTAYEGAHASDTGFVIP